MADQLVKITLLAQDKATAAVNAVRGGLNKLVNGIDDMMGRWKAALAGFMAFRSAISKTTELADLAAKATDIERSFSNLAATAGKDAVKFMSDMRTAAKGTISDMDLMEKSNKAMMLGGKALAASMPELIEIARASAAATGSSVEDMFDSIVMGMGKQRKTLLDDLGIIFDVDKANAAYAKTLGKQVSQLSEAEKKQAFMNAALKAGLDNVRAMGGSMELATDKAARLAAEQHNLSVALGKELLPYVNTAREYFIGLGKDMLSILNYFSLAEREQRKMDALQKQRLDSMAAERVIQKQITDVRDVNTASNSRNYNTATALDEALSKQQATTAGLTREIRAMTAARIEADAATAGGAGAAPKPKIESSMDAAELEKQIAADVAAAKIAEEEWVFIRLTEIDAMRAEALTLRGEEQKLKAKEIADAEVKLAVDTETAKQREKKKTSDFDRLLKSEEMRNFRAFGDFMVRNAEAFGKEGKNIAKAFMISETLMNTYSAAVAGYKAMVGIPIVGPILGPIAAAAATAFGMARVNQIRSMEAGGIIPGSEAGTLIRAGEKGKSEAIIPLEGAGAPVMGHTFNIMNFGSVLPDDFVEAIDRALEDKQRRGQSLFGNRIAV